MSLALQYTIVGVLILAAIVWASLKVYRSINGKKSGCCGCGLKDACTGRRERKKSSCCCNDDFSNDRECHK